jgi:hypothetical protein
LNDTANASWSLPPLMPIATGACSLWDLTMMAATIHASVQWLVACHDASALTAAVSRLALSDEVEGV